MVRFYLKEVLQKRGKDAVWLAKELCCSKLRAQRIAKGDIQAIRLETIERICTLLDCEVNDILKRD